MAKSLASQIILVGNEASNTLSTGALVSFYLSLSNDFYWRSVQLNNTFLRVKEVSGYAISENLYINFL
jgi:hypothetical protein